MEVRGISSIPANRPAASPNAVTAAAYPAPTATPPEGGRSPGGFISPVLRYDQTARVAVLYFRDTDTGETKEQIPAERVVEEYRRNAVRLNTGSEDKAEKGTGTATASDGMPSADTARAPASPAGDPGASPAASAGYSAPPAWGSFSGSGASSSAGSTGGGAPGGLVSVTV